MEFINLGRTGIKVSRLCLGTMAYGTPNWQPWILDEGASRPFYREVVDAGISFFDTADMYSLGRSEEVLGRALKELGTSRLDHDTPVDEVIEALHDVVKAGKVLYLGASSMFAWQFMKMLGRAGELGLSRFTSMQNYYNLAYREEEREMLPLCRAEGIAVLPYSPLARGFLVGNRRLTNEDADTVRTKTDRFARQHFYKPCDYAVVDRLTELAKARGISNARLSLAWGSISQESPRRLSHRRSPGKRRISSRLWM